MWKEVIKFFCLVVFLFGMLFLSFRFGYMVATKDASIESSKNFEEMVGKKEEVEKKVAEKSVPEKRKALERFVIKD